MQIAPNFTLEEFQKVSFRTLTLSEVERARAHAALLQRARDAVNENFPRDDGKKWIVEITSFLRPSDSSDHANGSAVDWTVSHPNGARSDQMTKWARDWLATNALGSFDRLLWEWNHNHHALRNTSRVPVSSPLVLDKTGEDASGAATFAAAILPAVDRSLPYIVAGLIVLGIIFSKSV